MQASHMQRVGNNETGISYFCIGHLKPAFDVPEFFVHVSPHAYSGDNVLLIPDDCLGDAFNGRFLSEYAQLFGLLAHVAHLPEEHELYLFQYRKFICIEQPSRPAQNVPNIYSSMPEEARKKFPSRECLKNLSGKRLIGSVYHFGEQSYAINYATYHRIEDFCAFCVSLAAQPGFDELRCREFINCNMLFAAPSLGLISVGKFRAHMNVLMNTWKHFHRYYYVERPDYQRRVGGFLLERLHSFLIYEEVIKAGLPSAQGFTTIVSDSDFVTPTI